MIEIAFFLIRLNTLYLCLSIVALLTPRFSKLILKEHSQIDNFNAKKLWGKKGKGVGQKHIDVWYTSL